MLDSRLLEPCSLSASFLLFSCKLANEVVRLGRGGVLDICKLWASEFRNLEESPKEECLPCSLETKRSFIS